MAELTISRSRLDRRIFGIIDGWDRAWSRFPYSSLRLYGYFTSDLGRYLKAPSSVGEMKADRAPGLKRLDAD